MGESLSKRRKGLVRRFLPYFRKYVWVMVFDLFCAALTTVCELTLPLLMRYVTDMGINDLASLTLQIVIKIGALYLFLCLVDAGATFFRASIGHIMGARMETDMRTQLFAHLQKLSFNYFDNMKVGQIMSRITTDLFDVTEFAHHCPEEIFMATIKIAGAFIILCGMNVPLTLIVFSVVPFMVLAAAYFNMKMRSQFRQQRSQIGEINAQVEDSLLGVRVVKSFANENVETEKFEAGNKKFFHIKRGRYYLMGGFEATNRMFDGLMHFLVLLVGAVFMINGKVQPADLVAYMLYVGTLITSIRQLVQFAEQFQQGMTGIERFFQILDADVDIFDEPGATPLKITEGGVHFEHVGFSYADDGKQVLSEINLDVKPGQNVALVGPSGSGKTTLCNLIPRFYDVTEGRIKIDGQDIKNVTLRSLREQIGFVQQDVYLFSGTVFENIEYGRPGATREEVIAAAKQAGAHGFITELSKGYDTYVGERGVKLSGGQKQRISIARAFLKNPPVMILDEATSALDNESEKIVQESLEKLSKGRTTFTIAHRLSTIKNATVILVLTENGIEEKGTHGELMAKGGVYYNLYSTYSGDKEG
ncbi:ABC transporter ATP-binding protein [Acutalibacter sp. 1XD8-36]|uniref:ABC transporter ATP-binding protein n=1 Tax=Acutalibacter sp. 1XD8-36 TaxID=2320852 RepID=UPI00141287EA|nr:ABC transporter ATP-binding protein [Acutalibacter sp. 1XD8-36]NBJ88872.1 ABC transporter ATP-binding protein [Acutalibacter sp. 1XD8-36]